MLFLFVLQFHASNDPGKTQAISFLGIFIISVVSRFLLQFLSKASNELFTFFTDNNLIFPNQSGFRPGDSCVNQLIAITHEIYKSFDDGLEVRGVFLDISKAFDKVWHEGLLLKLSLNGISGNLLKLYVIFYIVANNEQF